MKKLIGILLLAGAAFAQTPAQRYTILMSGNKAGYATTTQKPDGTIESYYEFNDRGRGPKITETITLDAAGVPVQLHAVGNDYMKAAVEEKYSFDHGFATWSNRAENGAKPVSGEAFYISISGTPEETGVLARALLKAPDHRLKLLPAGEALLMPWGKATVDVGGQKKNFTLYAINGLDFAPTPVWLSEDGQQFATVSQWYTVVPEGMESAVATLQATQDKLVQERAAQLAGSLGVVPKHGIVIQHANLFDSENATVRPHTTVVIAKNRVVAVGDDGKVAIPKGALMVEGAGKTLLPGLWDMHVHLQPNDGLLDIANGITTVRDMANDTDMLMAMRDRFENRTEIGPSVLMAGFIDGRGPYQGPTKVFADNVDEARADIDKYAQLGYVQIKVYSSLRPELVAPIAQMAHAHGLRLSGHVPSGMLASQFIEAGADEMQHINFVFLNFMPDVKETRTPARFTEVAKRSADIDLNSEQVKAFLKLLQEHHTVIDPTVAIFEGMFTDRPGKMSQTYAPVAARLPVQIQRGFVYGGMAVPDGMDQKYRDSFAQMLKMVKLLYDSGVPIVAGTDALAGFTLHRELELYNQAGIPAAKVLQLDTLGAARVMKRDGEVGRIAPNMAADAILVPGDPTQDISAVRNVQMVIKDGVVYRVDELDKALGVQPVK